MPSVDSVDSPAIMIDYTSVELYVPKFEEKKFKAVKKMNLKT